MKFLFLESYPMIYFSLAKEIYATEFEDAVIILNVAHDQYLSLIDAAAKHFKCIVSTPFTYHETNKYIPCIEHCDEGTVQSFNDWITEFLNQGFIIKTNSPETKKVNPGAKVSGGLREYRWDTKKDWKPLRKTSYYATLKALLTLIRVNRTIKKQSMRGLFSLVNTTKTFIAPTNIPKEPLEHIIAAVDSATKLYPKKTYCLGWATTFVIEARKKGINCNLVVGIQTNPFYAHAWAQLEDNTVVNDDPQITEVLSIIATLPEE
jgi:Transglutaminase-like superfamily